MMRYNEDIWGVTIRFSARYKKPVPLDEELRVVSRITKETSLSFEGKGEILLKDGTVAVEGSGKYLKMTLDKIADDVDVDHLEWKVMPTENDPIEVEL
jgi:acyl-CoA thioesterase FadM